MIVWWHAAVAGGWVFLAGWTCGAIARGRDLRTRHRPARHRTPTSRG